MSRGESISYIHDKLIFKSKGLTFQRIKDVYFVKNMGLIDRKSPLNPLCYNKKEEGPGTVIEANKVKLYHATDQENANKILKNGFLVEEHKKEKFKISFDYKTANAEALFLQCKKHKKPVIISIDLPESQYEKTFMHSHNSIALNENISSDHIKILTKNFSFTKEDCRHSRNDDSVYTNYLTYAYSGGGAVKFKECKDKFHGYNYGLHNEFCAVKENYDFNTLSNVSLDGTTSSPFKNCETDFKGISFGAKDEQCAVPLKDMKSSRAYHILGNQIAFNGLAAKEFENCSTDFRGIPFGPNKEFCAVTDNVKVLENAVYGHMGFSSSEFKNCASEFKGIPFGPNKEYCAVFH